MSAEFAIRSFEYRFTMQTPRFSPEDAVEVKERLTSAVDALLKQRWYRSKATVSPHHEDTLIVDYYLTAYTRDRKSVEEAVIDLHETACIRAIPEYLFREEL
jgi:hypothetical protein